MIAFAIFCCWVVSFFFNGIESGLLSINPVRLRQNVKRRVPAALRLDRLLEHPTNIAASATFRDHFGAASIPRPRLQTDCASVTRSTKRTIWLEETRRWTRDFSAPICWPPTKSTTTVDLDGLDRTDIGPANCTEDMVNGRGLKNNIHW